MVIDLCTDENNSDNGFPVACLINISENILRNISNGDIYVLIGSVRFFLFFFFMKIDFLFDKLVKCLFLEGREEERIERKEKERRKRMKVNRKDGNVWMKEKGRRVNNGKERKGKKENVWRKEGKKEENGSESKGWKCLNESGKKK